MGFFHMVSITWRGRLKEALRPFEVADIGSKFISSTNSVSQNLDPLQGSGRLLRELTGRILIFKKKITKSELILVQKY